MASPISLLTTFLKLRPPLWKLLLLIALLLGMSVRIESRLVPRTEPSYGGPCPTHQITTCDLVNRPYANPTGLSLLSDPTPEVIMTEPRATLAATTHEHVQELGTGPPMTEAEHTHAVKDKLSPQTTGGGPSTSKFALPELVVNTLADLGGVAQSAQNSWRAYNDHDYLQLASNFYVAISTCAKILFAHVKYASNATVGAERDQCNRPVAGPSPQSHQPSQTHKAGSLSVVTVMVNGNTTLPSYCHQGLCLLLAEVILTVHATGSSTASLTWSIGGADSRRPDGDTALKWVVLNDVECWTLAPICLPKAQADIQLKPN